MPFADSIFVHLVLPNPTVWFYFSALLAVSLFFKFSRLLSVRNLDVVTLFLFMPGLLMLTESGGRNLWGFAWLLGASGYFFARCLLDLGLVRRPVLSPNLTLGGLFCLAGTLFVSLLTVPLESPRGRSSEQGDPAPSSPSSLPDKALIPVGERVAQSARGNSADLDLLVARTLALLCHLAIAVGLVLIGMKIFQDAEAGAAAAALYLLLPYSFLLLPYTPLETALKAGRWDHAWPMAWIIWTVLAYRRPAVAGAFLGVAAAPFFFPVVVLPAWLGFYWGRGALRFGLSFVLAGGLCLGLIGLAIWLNGGEFFSILQSPWNQSTWQPWKAPPADSRSVWVGVHWAYRMPVFLAYLAFVGATAFWPQPKNLAHVLALSAAVLIGIQFWYADQGGVYVLWYLPFLVLLVFRPNLTSCQPPPPVEDWLTRLGRRLLRLLCPVCAANQNRSRSSEVGFFAGPTMGKIRRNFTTEAQRHREDRRQMKNEKQVTGND